MNRPANVIPIGRRHQSAVRRHTVTRSRRRLLVLLASLTLMAILAIPTSVGAVVNGNTVEPNEYPFFVRIEWGQHGYCGATLIDPEWLLTAAHCVDDLQPSQITARFGDHSQHRNYLSRTPIREIRLQPRWNGDATDGYDEALLRIDRNAIPAPVVAVGGPGANGSWVAGRPATIIGYGQLSATGAQPTIMQEVDTLIRSDDYMDDLYGVVWGAYDWWFAGGLIGAGGSGGTACYGDSGGPLLVRTGSTWLQVGITSFVDETFGNQCRQAAAFTELYNGGELAWIAHHVPSVTSTWGTCIISRNGFDLGSGLWIPTLNADGTGKVECRFTTGTPQPPAPTPIDQVCAARPWLCPDWQGPEDV